MKFIIFLLCSLFLEIESKEDIAGLEACASEVEGHGDQLLVKGSREYYCFHACLMKKNGIIKDDKVDADEAFNQKKKTTSLTLGALKDKINDCSEKANQEKNFCDVSKVYEECMDD